MPNTTTVTFEKDSTEITINGPTGGSPTEIICLPQSTRALSQGLDAWSYRGTDQYVEQWAMNFDELTLEQWQDLREFFYDVVFETAEEFTYTHTDGQQYTARFAEPGLTAQRRSEFSWAVRLKLEIHGDRINAPAGT